MNNSFKKLSGSIKTKGLINTIKRVYQKIAFESSIKKTALLFELRKSLFKNQLIIKYGSHKFKYYGSGDRGELLYHTFWDKLYKEEKDKIKDFIKPGDIVIDVGGNMGFFVLILNELVGDEGKIYSFEPSKRLKERLDKTVKINNIRNVTIVNLGLGESEGSTTLHYNPRQTGLSSIMTDFEGGSLSEIIQVTTLDKFSENIQGKVSFIKIDTEGYEPKVLKGARELISRDKPIIYIELGGDHQKTSIEALTILKEYNYSCEAENIDLTKVPAGNNFIALPKS